MSMRASENKNPPRASAQARGDLGCEDAMPATRNTYNNSSLADVNAVADFLTTILPILRSNGVTKYADDRVTLELVAVLDHVSDLSQEEPSREPSRVSARKALERDLYWSVGGPEEGDE